MHFFYKISYIIFVHTLFITLNSSELQLHKDSALSEYNVISSHDHFRHLTKNILTCIDEDNKLFVCYSGYHIVTSWNYGVIKSNKKTNILVEIDPYEKIERPFDQLLELDNEYPVIDITRSKDLYLVAHHKSLYLYNKVHTFMRHALQQKKQYAYPLTENDYVKKTFFNKRNNLIAVSACGAIYQDDYETSNNPTIVSNAFAQQEKEIHSIAYNATKNMIFFGLLGFVRITALDQGATYIINCAPNFPINIIDTTNSHILLSDLIENKHIKCDLQHNNGHLANKNCCREKYPGFVCKQCEQKYYKQCSERNQREQQWLNKKITKTITVSGSRRTVLNQLLVLSLEKYPEEDPKINCTHLPDSCLNSIITAIVIPFDTLIEHMTTNNTTLSLEKLYPQSFEYKTEALGTTDYISTITHLVLTNDSFISTVCEQDLTKEKTYRRQLYGAQKTRKYTITMHPLHQINAKKKDLIVCNPLYPEPGYPYRNGDYTTKYAFMLMYPTQNKKGLIKIDIGKLTPFNSSCPSQFTTNHVLLDVTLYTEKPQNKRNSLQIQFHRLWAVRNETMETIYSYLKDTAVFCLLATPFVVLYTCLGALSLSLKN